MFLTFAIFVSLLKVFVDGYTILEVASSSPCKIEIKKNGELERYIESTQDLVVIIDVSVLNDPPPWSRTFTFLLEDCDNCPATVGQVDQLDAENYTYQISLVDGFNKKISIEPGSPDVCRKIACLEDINAICPINNQVLDNGTVIACAPDPEVFEEACPEAATTTDDVDNIIACNDTTYYIKFDYE